MRLTQMKWRDFQSYRGEHELPWDEIRLACLIGANGSGKTTVVDLVRYALWGYTRTDADSVVARGGPESCSVTLDFAAGGALYRVTRTRSKKGRGKSDVTFERLSPNPAEIPEAQISAIIGMTDRLFTTTSCADQDNAAAFSKETATHRKEILGLMLGLGVWDDRASLTRAEQEAVSGQIERLRSELHAAETALELVARLELAVSDERQAAREAENFISLCTQDTAKARTRKEEANKELAKVESTLEHIARLEAQRKRICADTELKQGEYDAADRQAGTAPDLRKALEAIPPVRTALETKRSLHDKRKALVVELNTARERLEAVRKQHASEVRLAQQAEQAARDRYASRESLLISQLNGATEQTAVLDQVPCGGEAETCPLLAQARKAKTETVPRLEAELKAHRKTEPWRTAMTRVGELQGQKPGADLEAVIALTKTALDDNPGVDAAEIQRMEAAVGKEPQLTTALVRADAAADRAKALRKDLEALAAELTDVDKALLEQRKAAAGAPAIVDQVTAAQTDIDRLEAERKQWDAKRVSAIERTGRAQGDLEAAQRQGARAEDLRQEIGTLTARHGVLELLGNPRTGAFSKGGIPALLLEQAIPALEEVANEVLAELSEGALALRLSSQKELKRGNRTAETLDIMIADSTGERAYETYSGGEKMRVDLALRIALASTLAQQAGSRCEVLVLDETAAPLDAGARRQLAETLARIAGRFATILVVSHEPSVQDGFPTRIQVSRNAEGSRLEVISA